MLRRTKRRPEEEQKKFELEKKKSNNFYLAALVSFLHPYISKFTNNFERKSLIYIDLKEAPSPKNRNFFDCKLKKWDFYQNSKNTIYPLAINS